MPRRPTLSALCLAIACSYIPQGQLLSAETAEPAASEVAADAGSLLEQSFAFQLEHVSPDELIEALNARLASAAQLEAVCNVTTAWTGPTIAGEATLAEHLDAFCAQLELGWLLSGN